MENVRHEARDNLRRLRQIIPASPSGAATTEISLSWWKGPTMGAESE